ncbi:MAG: prephenate dehydrogenase/arogenate dehydrogenase family protein [Parcubacteria group bacterium]|nr:prephenate dehydrogenase/arogenate dehydrogenase family protein [Parcubacteria group bacterium]
MIVGIPGGNGKFGQWFVKFFNSFGYEVLVSDIDTELTNREVVEQSDVVVFSVPIGESVRVIEEMVPYAREGTVWTDITSLKVDTINAMRKSKAEVIGMHPMFKPTMEAKGQVVIFCTDSQSEWVEILKNAFISHGAIVKEMRPEEHDEMMAIIQGGTHLPFIAAGYAFKTLGADLEELWEIASPVYKMRVQMIGRILDGNPKLYAEIAVLNPNTKKIASNLLVAMQRLSHAIISEDVDEFVEIFKQASEFFGDFTKQAVKDTDYLIQKMLERENGEK